MASESKSWFVYVVRCRDGSFYTGMTNDLDKRIARHNDGKGGRYTASRRPVALFFHEPHPDRSSALRREMEIKKLTRQQKNDLSVPHSSVHGERCRAAVRTFQLG
ncbi:MAG: GIY-YIG nuclease family protein [candidate division Zixibacteria bacterium]|nr:GIY-YIG nuclease family protein [candidate division Zixibacteria bacterium]